jgi:putative glutamine amidotransferase
MAVIIGVTMCLDEAGNIRKGVDSAFIRREYGQAIRRMGAQPIFLDPSIDPKVAVKLCDGIVLSGGEDIDPSLYGQTVHHTGKKEPRTRTDWERQMIDICDQLRKPILGICYGSQLLNVHYGGTLYQDIHDELHSSLNHGASDAPVKHELVFETDFLGYRSGEVVTATARHHQAVANLAPGFKVMARAHDGTIEAIMGRGHFGIQWHAESDETADVIYGTFIAHCALRKSVRKKYYVLKRPNLRKLLGRYAN